MGKTAVKPSDDVKVLLYSFERELPFPETSDAVVTVVSLVSAKHRVFEG